MPGNDLLDLPLHRGQQAASFRFRLVDRRTGEPRGELTPLRRSVPTLSHDSTSTVSRRVSGLTLGAVDSARIRPLRDRIDIAMVLGDRARTVFPLGRYMVADEVDVQSTAGTLTPLTLYDETLIIDQELEAGFDAGGQLADQAIVRLLEGLPVGSVMAESTEHAVTNAWSAGTSRANVLNELASLGGYFKPWFGHHGWLRVRRAFEPGVQVPDIDLDDPPRVFRDSITRQSEQLTAPNRFVVVSNNLTGEAAPPVTGTYDVPSSAPHSIAQRGFVLPRVVDAQVTTRPQAQVYARTLGLQQTVYEVVELSTPPDPRHDGYQVVRWNGVLWLEVGWSMPLAAGAEMRHTLRRAYPTTELDER